VLLLDEPTNHLDVESIEWLEKFLLDQNNLTLLFISHDRSFVDSIATRIVELDRGTLRSYEGNYSRYLELKAQQMEAEEKQNALFDFFSRCCVRFSFRRCFFHSTFLVNRSLVWSLL
jgi:ABC transport system ATP-binding/permease protein